MSLTPNQRVGQYEVLAVIGAGGMGEVFRARDTQLKRDVALKILPAGLEADPDRLARFQREAEILASLNHTNIAHLYGLTEADGVRALVMELVEGPTLADRIEAGRVPLDEALAIARQIAEALEAAHAHGIIHRDLKPANVKVTPDDVVKVLDFGLAKALDANAASAAADNSPTITSPAMTRAGVIMGTAAYMSPEQARGRAVDARTDIWAFGCVLYEMLTGRGPFAADTITDVLGAIVHKEPDWTALPAGTPERVRRLLQRCLAKDAKQRLHDIADVRLEIEDAIAARRAGVVESEAAGPGPPRGMTTREAVAWALAAVAIATAIGIAWLGASGRWSSGNAAGVASMRVSILPVEGSEVGAPVISPDGRRVAYPARGADGIPRVWVRDLDQSAPRSLGGTESGSRLFWSPDSRQVGFIVGDILKRVPADGGPVQEITRGARAGSSWGAGDVVVFQSTRGELRRTSVSGGPVSDVTTLPGSDWEHAWPSLLPDGRHFLFTAKQWTGLAESGAQGIYLGSIDDPTGFRQLLPDRSSAIFAPPGQIVFARDGQLMSVPFDVDAGRLTGDPVALGEAVAVDPSYFFVAASASSNGDLAFRPPPAWPIAGREAGLSAVFEGEMAWFGRDGSTASRFGGSNLITYYMALSPDARAVVAQLQDVRTGTTDLWRFDVTTGARTALTSMRSGGGYAGSPVFSPDGTKLAFGCQVPGMVDDVCVRDMASGQVTTLVESKAAWEHPSAWSADGQYLLVNYNAYTDGALPEVRVWSMRSGTLSPYIAVAGDANDAIFSPDGRFVAYDASDTGRVEVSVTTFPERRQTWPLTTDGGRVISWRADGKEILVATLAGHIAAYPVDTTGGNFSAGAPQVLVRNLGFDAPFARATPDHSRILLRIPKDVEKDRGEIRLLFGWNRK